MKNSILVVEDNQKLLSSIATLLEDDFDVHQAINGREGIEKARFHMPDIIISDIMMPEVSGYELVEELKAHKRTRHIPIILLTALGDDEKKIEGYEYGADDYVVKPFKFDVLFSRIHNLLRGRELLRDVFERSAPVNHEFGVKDPLLAHLEALIINHYNFRDYSISGIAEKMNIKVTKLERQVKKLTGMTPVKYLNDLRLSKAKMLIEQGEKSIFEISYTVGFNNVSYFTKAYKEKFGVSPSKSSKL